MDAKEIGDRLAEPFDAAEVKWKPQTVKGNRALAVAYIDARVVEDRLDEVLGVGGWQDEYHILPDGAVMCKLSVKIGGEWVTKCDVGGESEQPDSGDRTKAAFSDALKRAAVKWGVGRYIYRLGHQWCDYDMAKKQFTNRPQLPKWALPGPVVTNATLPAKQPYPEPVAAEPKALPQGGRPDKVVIQNELKLTGLKWAACMAEVNTHFGMLYTQNTKFDEVLTDHLVYLLGWLQSQPALPEVQPA